MRDARLGGVPPGARLDLTVAGGARRPLPLVGGRFRADALPAGRVTLTAAAPGYVTTTREIEVVAGDRLHDVTTRDVRIEMERGGVVTGRVRDDRGDPVADVTIAAAGLRARSDREGLFRLDGVPPGRVRVSAEKGGTGASEELEVRAGDETRAELRLR